jgi:hypothetical protein
MEKLADQVIGLVTFYKRDQSENALAGFVKLHHDNHSDHSATTNAC